jgi:hypothetical protein
MKRSSECSNIFGKREMGREMEEALGKGRET